MRQVSFEQVWETYDTEPDDLNIHIFDGFYISETQNHLKRWINGQVVASIPKFYLYEMFLHPSRVECLKDGDHKTIVKNFLGRFGEMSDAAGTAV